MSLVAMKYFFWSVGPLFLVRPKKEKQSNNIKKKKQGRKEKKTGNHDCKR